MDYYQNNNNEVTKNRVSRFAKRALGFLLPIIVVALIFLVLLSLADAKISELEAKLELALKETEHIEVTNVHIEEKLVQIGELATMSFEYTNQKTISNTRQLFGVDIFGTTNTVDVIYSGVIKVGYDVEDIIYEVDQEKQIIMLTLPPPRVLDNYIILDTMQCSDQNNIFNPIGSEDMTRFFAEIQEEELSIAIDKGIMIKAEDRLKEIVKNYFSEFAEYEVLFLT